MMIEQAANAEAGPVSQARLPALHRNVWRALQRDYGDWVDPSTPVFIRAACFGFCAETAPKVLRLLVAVLLRSRKGLTRAHVKRFAKELAHIVRQALSTKGLAFFFGAALGGSRWLSDRIIAFINWSQIRRNRLRGQDNKEIVSETEPIPYRTRILATFAGALISTWCTFELQTPSNPLQKHAAASDLPLVAFPDLASHNIVNPDFDPTLVFTEQRYNSPTLDFTLFLLVRAADTALRAVYSESRLAKNKFANLIARKGDIALFVLSAWRIMFVWFYKPWLLPPEYDDWIHSLARIEPGLLQLLRHARKGEWVYGKTPASEAARQIGPSLCENLGLDPVLGMPDRVRAFPCQVAHGRLGNTTSCEVNLLRRWSTAWLQSMALYFPVHFLPILLFSSRRLLQNPVKYLRQAILGSSRSAAFLATFVAGVWGGVCYGRTRIGPYLTRSQQIWDGGLAMMLGTFICGFSVLLENKRRRGEMALFVAPRALYAILDEILPTALLKGSRLTALLERMVFSLSAATVITAAVHKPEHIRGIVRSIVKLLIGDWKFEKKDERTPASGPELDSNAATDSV